MLINNYKRNEFKYEIYLCESSYPYNIIGCLTNASTNRVFKWQLRNIDELSLQINKYFEDGRDNKMFDIVEKANVIKVEKWIDDYLEDTYLYHISEINIISDIAQYKEIKAYSLEIRMNERYVRNFNYTTQIYTGTWNSSTPTEGGIVDYILTLFSGNWKVGYVTPSLIGTLRTFDIPTAKVLDAIRVIENNFDCIFIYHTYLQTIDIVEYGDPLYSLGLNANTGLILDHKNYVEQYKSQMNLDDIITRLYVNGDGISSVNLLGTEYIDDFTFFMNTKYMSQELIDALNNLEVTRESQETTYNTYIENRDTLENEILILDTQIYGLGGLYGQLLVLEDKQDYAIKNDGTFDGQTYAYWKAQTDLKQAEIDVVQEQIITKRGQINTINQNITTLNTSISYENNLTNEQLKELSNFIKEGEVTFDSDDPSVLLELGRSYLNLNSKSTYDISVNITDIFGSKMDSYVWNKIKLGHKVNLLIPYE